MQTTFHSFSTYVHNFCAHIQTNCVHFPITLPCGTYVALNIIDYLNSFDELCRLISIYRLISRLFSRLFHNKWHLCCTGHWFSHQTFPFNHKKLATLLCCLPTCHNYQTFKCYCVDLSAFIFIYIFVDCVWPDDRIWENERMYGRGIIMDLYHKCPFHRRFSS